jgi:nucleoside-diphosphate kinase
MIKPDHVNLAEQILGILDQYGRRTMQGRVDSVTKELIEYHYTDHRGRPYFPWMAEHFVGRPAVPAVYEGQDVIKKVMDAIGPTDPAKAPKDTIRGKFSDDSPEVSIAQHRHPRNVIHRADCVVAAEREIALWLQYMRELR